MTKAEVMALIEDKPNMTKGELKHLVNGISLKGEYCLSNIKTGGVFVHKAFNHPAIVVKKVTNNTYMCLTLTMTPKDCFILTKVNNRFVKEEQFVTLSMVITDFESISKNYMYSIDSKEAIRIQKLFKEFMFKNL